MVERPKDSEREREREKREIKSEDKKNVILKEDSWMEALSNIKHHLEQPTTI